jgi:hypothetical protein
VTPTKRTAPVANVLTVPNVYSSWRLPMTEIFALVQAKRFQFETVVDGDNFDMGTKIDTTVGTHKIVGWDTPSELAEDAGIPDDVELVIYISPCKP